MNILKKLFGKRSEKWYREQLQKYFGEWREFYQSTSIFQFGKLRVVLDTGISRKLRTLQEIITQLIRDMQKYKYDDILTDKAYFNLQISNIDIISECMKNIEIQFNRRESALFYGVPKEIMDILVANVSNTYKWVHPMEFKTLMELFKIHERTEGVAKELERYKGSRLIVKNVFDSSSDYSSKQTWLVFAAMRAETEMHRTLFFMFTDPDNPGVEKRYHDNKHPMFNWCPFIDVSKI